MLKILYLDQDVVVVHKPSGLLVHRSAIDRHETRFLLQMLRDQIGQHVYPVHRLDKPTSGLMVLALHKQAATRLTSSFTERQTKKSYLAVVRGYVNDQVIDYPLKELHDKMTDHLADKDKSAQDAVTQLKLIDTVEVPEPVGRYASARFSLVKLFPRTGRKHQLRRHMAHIRHPILGDTTHGDGKQNKFARSYLNLNRLALIADELSFPHPTSNECQQFTTDIDDDLKRVFGLFALPN